MTEIPFHRSFESEEKAKYWSELNNVKPDKVSKTSNKKFWFNCQCGHTFESVLSNVTKGSWCPFCCNPQQKLCGNLECHNCTSKSVYSHPKASCWSVENDVNSFTVNKNSTKSYKWLCECGHLSLSSPHNFLKSKGCKYCSSNSLCDNDGTDGKSFCKLCNDKSFASHPRAKFWDTLKNANVTPRQVFKSSGLSYWFYCSDCNHSFNSAIYAMNQTNIKCGCPYCATPSKLLCDDNNCTFCESRSAVIHPDIVEYWSEINDKTPRQVFPNSHTEYWFNCFCGHKYKCKLSDFSKGIRCGYCNYNNLCENDGTDGKPFCQLCNDKSFASHPKAIFWSKKNTTTPRMHVKGSEIKKWFDCPHCKNEYEKSLCKMSTRDCPHCKNKTELKLFTKMKCKYSELQREISFEWCIRVKRLRFDFVVGNIIIELDGRQHFENAFNTTAKRQYENDKYKEKCANDNGYSVIRICQTDVWNDTYDWCKNLCEAIEEIKKSDSIMNIYLCKNGEYDHF